jgi:hypothetical protein
MDDSGKYITVYHASQTAPGRSPATSGTATNLYSEHGSTLFEPEGSVSTADEITLA